MMQARGDFSGSKENIGRTNISSNPQNRVYAKTMVLWALID